MNWCRGTLMNLALLTVSLSATATLHAAVILTTAAPYTEGFSGDLGAASPGYWTTTNAQKPIPGTSGWDGVRLGGTGASMNFNVDDGGSTAGALFSYGMVGSSDRALGSIASGTNIGAFGVELVNNSGSTIDSVDLNYLGEFWRSSTSTQNVLTFFYQVGASGSPTYLSDSNDIPLPALNLTGPAPVAANGALDGTTNNAMFSSSISNLNWANGTSLYLAWRDNNDTGNDAGLAVDNFSLTPHVQVAAPTWTGGGSNSNWSTAANWTIAPADGKNLVFTGSTRTTTTNDNFLHSVGSISFDSNAGAFTLGGSDLTVGSGIANNSANAQSINLNLTLGAAQTFNAASGNLSFGGTVSLSSSVLTVGGPQNVTFSGSVSGAGSGSGMTKIGAGSATFSAANNNLHGPLQITGGTVVVSNGASLSADFGNSATTSWDGGLSGGGAVNLAVGSTADATGNLATQGTLQINSGSASPNFSGTVNISGNGQVIVQSPNQPLGTGQIKVQSSGLQFNTALNQTGDLSKNKIVLGGDGVSSFNVYVGATFSNFRSTLILGSITGTGTVYIQNNQLPGAGFPLGTPNVANGGGTVEFSGASKYVGDTFVNLGTSGIVQILNDDALPTTTNLTMGSAFAPGTTPTPLGGTLDLNGHNQTIASLATGAAAAANATVGKITDNSMGTGASTITISGPATTTFAFPIQDGANGRQLAITRAGSGTTILAGANTYTGPTTISGGKLQLGADNSINSTSNLILAGGTFATDGHLQTFFTPVSLLANSTIDLGTGASIVQFADSHTQTWTSGAVLRVANWSGSITGSGTDQLLVGDSSETGLTAAQLSHIHFSGFHTGAVLVGNGEVVPANATPLLRGDVNQDNHVNASDVSAMLSALTNINAYKAAHPTLDAFEASDMLDVNQDGSVNNADLQSELDLLAHAGAGSSSLVTTVPEPPTSTLAVLALVAVAIWR
jgi:autotransporter-associated beta strand protein